MLVTAATLAGLAAGTLLSEDLTSIGAGLLVREGRLSATAAVAACAAGVYVGDLGLWLAGRLLGRRVLAQPWLAGRLDAAALEELSARLDARLGAVVLGSRFLPGSRLPIYVAAGVWGRRPLAFAAWSLLAVLLWTPALVLGAARLGPELTVPVAGERSSVLHWASTAVVLFGALHVTGLACRGRRRSLLLGEHAQAAVHVAGDGPLGQGPLDGGNPQRRLRCDRQSCLLGASIARSSCHSGAHDGPALRVA